MEAKNIEKEEKNLKEVPNVDNINFDQIVIDAADEQKSICYVLLLRSKKQEIRETSWFC